MLIDFSIKNYKSIKESLSVDMNFSQQAPKNYQKEDNLYFTDIKNNRIIPFLAIYGANASGKTNIISALNDLKLFIISDFNARERPLPYTPYLLSESTRNAVTEFSITLEKNSNIYRYQLAFTNNSVVDERLYKIKTNKSEELIFDTKNKKFNINVDSSYNLTTIFDNECNYFSSFLVKLATRYVGFSKEVNEVYDFIRNDLEIYPSNRFHESFAIDKAQIANDDDFSKAVKKISSILSNMDINLEGVNCNRSINTLDNNGTVNIQQLPNQRISWKVENPDKIQMRLDSFKSYHKDDQGNDVEFDFLTQESYGTVTLFGLLGVIIDVLARGKTLVIDEIERSLHSDIVRYIMRMFRNKKINKNRAQLICASHDLHSMDDLKKSEIAIVDKIKNATELKYVSDFDVRNDLDFQKNYLSGRFGGRPRMVFDTNVMED